MSRTIDGTFGTKNADPLSIRPFNFGTDAIERQRVSLGQSIIDADFEYGLQGTKWQSYQEVRKCPSFYEIPGTDLNITNVVSDGLSPSTITATISTLQTVTISFNSGSGSTVTTTAASGTLTIGSYIVGLDSIISGPVYIASNTSSTAYTLTFQNQTFGSATNASVATIANLPPLYGNVINVSGLYNTDGSYDSAMGFFLTTSNVTATGTFTYQAKIKTVPASPALYTSYTVIRRGGVLNNGNARIQASSITFANTASNTTFTVTTTGNHGLVPGTPIVTTGITTGGSSVGGANGNFFIDNVATATTFTYSSPNITTNGTLTLGRVYTQPYSYTIHRPFDGGVILGTGQPANGSSVMRQSKKVFRYQSGKGMLWSSGTLFCPNNDISSLSASGTTSGSTITVTTSIPHGAPQFGATVQIRGVTTSGYNGTYSVNSVINSTQLTVLATQTLGSTSPTLGDQPRFIMSGWHGASIRAGCFEDQNGLFWEYDGQTLWVVKRSSTFQIAGTVYTTQNSQTLTGVATRFQDQLKVGDKITIRGMTHTITGIASQTSLYFNPPYRGSADIASSAPVICCKIKELRVPQPQFNRDTIDGNGASGYKVDLTKMQMLGIQYTWYGAGFADFMIRGGDGNWVYVHRFRNNNVNDEAYMRTGNMPVRYEIVNESTTAVSTLAQAMTSGDLTMTLNDDLTYWPSNATVLVDQELIYYANKTSNTLTGLIRGRYLNYNVADTAKTFNGSVAQAHLVGNSVNVVSCTCAPSLTHWGSAFIMDGQFDNDRGYFFNYTFNQGGVSAGASVNAFFLRLSPSVSNGVVGDIGTRDLLNRAQLLLQQLDVGPIGTSGGTVNIVGILNPSGFEASTFNWQAINSPIQGGQPSFAQVALAPPSGAYVTGSGERIFSTIAQYGSMNSINLSSLKELSNAIIGGNRMYPDGPDTLMIQIQALNQALTSCVLNLYWSEAQA